MKLLKAPNRNYVPVMTEPERMEQLILLFDPFQMNNEFQFDLVYTWNKKQQFPKGVTIK